MRKVFRIATGVVVVSIFCAHQVCGDELPRYDKKIEEAAAERAASRLGALRGAIHPEARNVMHDRNFPRPPKPGFPILKENAGHSSLPPIVLLETHGVVPMAAGVASPCAVVTDTSFPRHRRA
jgi:hypothetical protein